MSESRSAAKPARANRNTAVRRFSLRRRLAIGTAAVAMFAMGAVTAGLDAHASSVQSPAAKPTLGAANVSATATGLRVPFFSHQGEDAEAEVPYAAAQLGAGGNAHALTSIFWPGSTGAAFGSTLDVLNLGLPRSLTNNLNDPYKAEAPSVDGKDTVTMNQGAVTMQAVAKPDHASSTAGVGPATNKALAQIFGSINATTNIRQTTDRVVADARSAVANVSIGGVLSIGSVVSTVHAVTNGTHSHGTASTQVFGVKIAGVNVTVDQHGVAVSGKGLLPPSVLATLSKTVNNALKSAGMRMFVARGTSKIKGPSVNLDSGDLIIAISNHGYSANVNDTGMVLELGGASVSANGSPGYVAPVAGSTVPPSTPAPAATTPSSAVPPAPSTGTLPGPSSAPAPVTAPPPVVAPAALKLPSGLGAGWVVLGVILAGLFALGMKRLPDQVLAATGPACHLEEDS
jgi:hypothetical protein